MYIIRLIKADSGCIVHCESPAPSGEDVAIRPPCPLARQRNGRPGEGASVRCHPSPVGQPQWPAADLPLPAEGEEVGKLVIPRLELMGEGKNECPRSS